MKTEKDIFQSKEITAIGVALGVVMFGMFLWLTKMAFIPVLLYAMIVFLLYPFRKESEYIKRFLLLTTFLFAGWLLSQLGFSLVPFAVAFLIAYVCDPLVSFLHRKKIPRWISSLLLMLIFFGGVGFVSVYIFPAIFMQLNDAIKKITSIVTTVNTYLDTRKIYRVLDDIGIKNDDVQKLIRKEVVPEIKAVMTGIFNSLLNLLTGISGIATKVFNVILIPIFSFYFLKDFNKFKNILKSILEKKNAKFLSDLRRINDIFKIYISWQFIAATMVATFCSAMFSAFGIVYPIVLGIISGVLNPIPYIGFIASMLIGSLTIIIIEPANLWMQLIVLNATIGGIHIINTYFIEPNVLGKRVGLHPLILFLALFLFGSMFGFIGMLIAVPCTATLLMFFNDWRSKLNLPDNLDTNIM